MAKIVCETVRTEPVTLIAELRNPAWTRPLDHEVVLETTQTLRTMSEAANELERVLLKNRPVEREGRK